MEDHLQAVLLPAIMVVATLAGLALIRGRPLRVSLAVEAVLIGTIAALLIARGTTPLPTPSQVIGRVDGPWLKALSVIWWLVAARLIATVAVLALGRDARSRKARLFSDLIAGGVYASALFVVLNSVLDLPVRGVVATSGVIAIVLGLALQNTLSDLFSGIAVELDQPFRLGERLSVGDVEGLVAEVNWRSIRLQTDGTDVVTIPNSIVAKSQLTNRSRPTEQRAATVELTVRSRAPAVRIMEALRQATLLSPAVLAWAVAEAVLAFGASVLVARTAIRPLFALLARSGGDELFTAAALAIALVAGWAAERVGLSMTLGAFLGGMMLAESPFRAVVRAEIAPFRGLLLGFFFISVGAFLEPAALAAHWPAVVGLALGTMVLKCASNAAASLVFRWSLPGSVQLGFLLAQGSEFAFVILGVPAVRAILGPATVSELTAAVALTLALTPSVSSLGRLLAGRLRRAQVAYAELKARSEAQPVLILGMGEVGRTVADALGEFGIGYDAVESDPKVMRESLADGYRVVFGDFSDPRLWRAIELVERRFSVVTNASRALLDEVGPIATALYSGARHVLVSSDRETAADLARSEFDVVFEDASPLGMATARHLLTELALPTGEIDRWADHQRARA